MAKVSDHQTALNIAVRFIQKSPEKYVPLFKKDPEAFVLEAMTEVASFPESLATSLLQCYCTRLRGLRSTLEAMDESDERIRNA